MRRSTLAYTTIALLSACAGHRSQIDLGPPPAGVVVDARLQYYDVTAANLLELRRGMLVFGPRWEGRAYQAVTESRFKWEYLPERKGPELCEPSRVRVTVQTMVTFPRWNAAAEPDSAMVEWWQQLSVGLMEHERGHARLSVKTAGDIARALEDMGPANSASPSTGDCRQSTIAPPATAQRRWSRRRVSPVLSLSPPPSASSLRMSPAVRMVLLLTASNVFMTFAWYAHLRNLSDRKWYVAALASWGIALFEYLLQVPANRIGYTVMTLPQLKIMQEVITLAVFVPFAVLYMRQPLKLDYLWASLCILGAVFFMFRGYRTA